MDTAMLTNKFERMGARVKFSNDRAQRAWQAMIGRVRIDIGRDKRGEFFEIQVNPNQDMRLDVVDVRPSDRHLLLMVDDAGDDAARDDREGKQKFLCGHDERHWFVAAVPEKAAASNVATALEALKPPVVRHALTRQRVKGRDRNRRRNRAFVRQGEWFFIPAPGLWVKESLVLRKEPLRRGNGKPHIAELLYRSGGQTVYVGGNMIYTAAQYRKWVKDHPHSRVQWRVMRRDMDVYVKGRISHADHKTIRLDGWHRVVQNTETQAVAMRHVVFVD